jgi:hypothetical protein
VTAPRDNLRRPVSWWACEAISIAALVGFFFALFYVLAVIAPGRMPL